jgi:hypothetical protein
MSKGRVSMGFGGTLSLILSKTAKSNRSSLWCRSSSLPEQLRISDSRTNYP